MTEEQAKQLARLNQIAEWALAAFAALECKTKDKEAKNEFKRRRDFTFATIHGKPA